MEIVAVRAYGEQRPVRPRAFGKIADPFEALRFSKQRGEKIGVDRQRLVDSRDLARVVPRRPQGFGKVEPERGRPGLGDRRPSVILDAPAGVALGHCEKP